MKIIHKTREELLQEALEVISREGLAKFTIRSLADHAQVSVGTLYNYFGDKDSLLEELMDYYWKDAVESLTTEARSFRSIAVLADALFIQLAGYSARFHRDFIRDRDPATDPEPMKRSMRKVFLILQNRVSQALEQMPYDEGRFGPRSAFANLLIDQVVACLQRKETDLGSLKIMINYLEEQ